MFILSPYIFSSLPSFVCRERVQHIQLHGYKNPRKFKGDLILYSFSREPEHSDKLKLLERMGNASARTTNHVPEMTEKEKMQQMYPGGKFISFSLQFFFTFHNSDAFEQTPTWRCRKIIFERSSCLQDSTHQMWWKVLSRRRMFKHMQSRMFTIWDDPPWKSSRTRTEMGTFFSL